VFGPLSREWNSVCTEFMSCSPNNMVTKWEWPRLFRLAYERTVTPSNIVSGFRKCGIFPLTIDAVPQQAFAPSQPFDKFPETTREDKVVAPVHVVTPHSVEMPSINVHSAGMASQAVFDEASSLGDLPDGASLLSDEDFIKSVLAGEIQSSLDESGNLVIEVVSLPPPVIKSELVGEEIAVVRTEFSLPTPDPSTKRNTRKLTSHRILTSEDIIQLKRDKAQQKQAQEEQKEARKQARLQKRVCPKPKELQRTN